MAHIQDRWWRPKKDPETGEPVLDTRGRPVREKTPLYGKGDRYRVRWNLPDGSEPSQSFPDKQLGKAKKFKTKIENDLLAGVYIDPDAGTIKVREWGGTYLKGRSPDESSQISLGSLFKCQVYPFMGDLQLDQITPTVLREWLAWMNNESKISVNYQADAWDNVSAMLDAAVLERKIRENPCRNRSISKPKRVERKITPWPESRLRRIELALPSRHRICIPIGAGLGLRQGEIFAFTMDDIDRRELVYNCNRQVVYRNGILSFKLPKGHKTRTVPLGQGILDALDEYTEEYPPVRIALPWAERDGKKTETVNVLMPYGDTEVWRAQMFNNDVWMKAFKTAGLTYRNTEDGMHALRHLFASHMLAQGVSIKELAAYLGHSSEAFTLRKYVHLMPSSHARARLAIDALFRPGERLHSSGERDEAAEDAGPDATAG